MALVVKDRVRETTTTVGTGTLTLAGAVTNYRSFSDIGNANTTYYTIEDAVNNTWEVGIGTYTLSGTTLSRDTVLASSNSGSLVTLGTGSKSVFCGYPASKAVLQDSTGTVYAPQFAASNGFNTYSNIVSSDFTFPANHNAITGSMTVNGVTVTLNSTNEWVVI